MRVYLFRSCIALSRNLRHSIEVFSVLCFNRKSSFPKNKMAPNIDTNLSFCGLVTMLSWFYTLQASQQQGFCFGSPGARCYSVCMFFPFPRRLSAGSLVSFRAKGMHLGSSWWLRIDLWHERECEWLSVSVFLTCDELTACPGQSAPLAPRQMGEAPAPRKAPLRDKAVDDGQTEDALPRLILQTRTTWNPFSDTSIAGSQLTLVLK